MPQPILKKRVDTFLDIMAIFFQDSAPGQLSFTPPKFVFFFSAVRCIINGLLADKVKIPKLI